MLRARGALCATARSVTVVAALALSPSLPPASLPLLSSCHVLSAHSQHLTHLTRLASFALLICRDRAASSDLPAIAAGRPSLSLPTAPPATAVVAPWRQPEEGAPAPVHRCIVAATFVVPLVRVALLAGSQHMGTARPLASLEVATLGALLTDSTDELLARATVAAIVLADTRPATRSLFKQILAAGRLATTPPANAAMAAAAGAAAESGAVAPEHAVALTFHKEPSSCGHLQVLMACPRVFANTDFIVAVKVCRPNK